MNKSFKFSSIVVSMLLVPVLSGAQELQQGYFLGGNPYAFRQNPAFQSERGIFSLALGQTGLGVSSNLGISTLLYPGENNTLYTFMNDHVSTSEFLGKIGKRNSLGLDAQVNLLTMGFWTREDTFVTLDFNVRSVNSVAAPYDLFAFLKEGTEMRSSFDFSRTGFRSKTFAEAAFGWSRNFDDVFNIGFRVKGLVGLLEVDAQMKSLQMTMNEERWSVESQGSLHASSPALSYRVDENGDVDFSTLSVDMDKFAPAGYGGAVDLGFSWNVFPYLTVSGSLLDLGAIRWNRELTGASEGDYSWVPSDNETEPLTADSVDKEVNEAADALAGVFRFKASGNADPAFEMLPFRANLGAEFRMPFYDRLSVGALYTGRGGSCYARHTGRLSLNWNMADWFSLSTGTTVNKLGESFGFAFNLHPGGINLLVGCDYVPLHCVNVSSLFKDMPEQYRKFAVLPTDRMNLNLYISLNLALGRRHLDHNRNLYWE